jgi:hypothetical protein
VLLGAEEELLEAAAMLLLLLVVAGAVLLAAEDVVDEDETGGSTDELEVADGDVEDPDVARVVPSSYISIRSPAPQYSNSSPGQGKLQSF